MRTTLVLLAMVTSVWTLADRSNAADAAIQSIDRAEKRADVGDKFVVHEWGTFTTFSGSDGVYLDFRPLAVEKSDLPNFVLSRSTKSPLFSKSRIRGKVRMETPVTYFYTDRIREVNVRVGFPEGLLTEFYPPVREMLPPFDEKVAFKEGEPIGNSSLDWGKVTLIPISQLTPNIEDPVLREQISRHLANCAVPHGPGGQHYEQARATDSALVHVRATNGPAIWPTPDQSYMEKFLFYRGVGRFELPVKAVFDSRGRVTLRNDGQLPLESAILINVESGSIRARTIGQIGPNGESRFESMQAMTLDELSLVTKSVLVDQGLYEKEAASMVETWKQSWFSEEGTRVLYIVPEQTTDELLPLTIEPSPDETLRVLVGRMEILPPDAEQQLIKTVRESGQAREVHQKKPEDKKREPFALSEKLLSYGRMMEPALVRVSKIAGDSAVRAEADRLIAQVQK
jgi:hypothetical protein